MAEAFKFNGAFLDDLSKTPEVVALCMAPAQKIAGAARASAPVGETGNYRDGIRVRVKYQRRAVVLVEATDEKSMLIESKTGNLARALRSVKSNG